MQQNDPGNVFSRLGFAQIAGIAATIIIANLVLVPLTTQTNLQKISDIAGPSMILLMVYVPQILYLLVFWLVVRPIPKMEWQKETPDFKTLVKIFLMMYSVSSIINNIGLQLTNRTPGGNSQLDTIQKMQTSGVLMGILIPVIIGPILEELIFRKLMIDRIRNYGEKTAIIFSSICFGLFHGNLTQCLFAACIGLFLGYVYCKTGKVLYTMSMHMLMNGFSSVILLIIPLMETPNEDRLAVVLVGVIILLLIIGIMTVSGIILLIRWIKRKLFVLDESMPECIPQHEVFRTVYLNPGVILFFLISVFEIIAGLFNWDISIRF